MYVLYIYVHIHIVHIRTEHDIRAVHMCMQYIWLLCVMLKDLNRCVFNEIRRVSMTSFDFLYKNLFLFWGSNGVLKKIFAFTGKL